MQKKFLTSTKQRLFIVPSTFLLIFFSTALIIPIVFKISIKVKVITVMPTISGFIINILFLRPYP